MIRLSVDFEHSSRTWWENGGQALWDGISEAFEENAIILDDTLAESWLAQARMIAGWDAGPEYAPHPINAAPADEDLE